MKKLLVVMVVLGMSVMFLGCEKAQEPTAVEEGVVVEEVTAPPPAAPVAEQPAEEKSE